MVHITSTLILLAASLLVAGTPVPDAKADLSNAERMKRGMALISPRKLFDATKRDTAERAVASPSPNFSTYRCNHGNTPVCCYFGEVPADDTCFNAFSGTGGAPTTDPFTCQAVNALRPGASTGTCFAGGEYTPAAIV